jgi:magnesium transporter
VWRALVRSFPAGSCPAGVAQLAGVAERFGLHPLAVEDAVHAHQRPELEAYEDSLFAVVKTVHYDDPLPGGTRRSSRPARSWWRRRLESDSGLLGLGPSVVLHAVLDSIVDSYVVVCRALQEDIDEAETAVFTATCKITDSKVIRDVDDHLSEVVDRVNGFDELLTTLVSANLARVSVVHNEDICKIFAWFAIAAVPTMPAGICGMNFDNMPELHWRFGYPLLILVMVDFCTALYRAFKRNGWL